MKSYKFRINGNEYNVDINSVEGNIADVTVNGTSYQVEMENAPAPVQKPVQAPAATTVAPASPAATTPAPKPAAPAGAGKPVSGHVADQGGQVTLHIPAQIAEYKAQAIGQIG